MVLQISGLTAFKTRKRITPLFSQSNSVLPAGILVVNSTSIQRCTSATVFSSGVLEVLFRKISLDEFEVPFPVSVDKEGAGTCESRRVTFVCEGEDVKVVLGAEVDAAVAESLLVEVCDEWVG